MIRKTRRYKYKHGGRYNIKSKKHNGGKGFHIISSTSAIHSNEQLPPPPPPPPPRIPRSSPTRHSRQRREPEPDIFRVYFKINGPDITDIDRTRRQFSLQLRMGFQVRNPDPLRMVIFEHVPDPDSVIHDNTPNSVILSCYRRIPYYEECMDHVIELIRRYMRNNLPLHLRIHDGGQLREYVI